jgi:hypothetical protein
MRVSMAATLSWMLVTKPSRHSHGSVFRMRRPHHASIAGRSSGSRARNLAPMAS